MERFKRFRWPGIFVEGASSPDKRPDSPTTNVDDEGCSKSERDTDQDGNDLLDNCPEQPKGPDGYDDGCPLPVSETDDGETMILGMTLPVFGGVLAGGIVGLLLLTMVIGRLRNRGYDFDDDDDDDDFFDDDDDEDDFFFVPKQTDAKSFDACTSKSASSEVLLEDCLHQEVLLDPSEGHPEAHTPLRLVHPIEDRLERHSPLLHPNLLVERLFLRRMSPIRVRRSTSEEGSTCTN